MIFRPCVVHLLWWWRELSYRVNCLPLDIPPSPPVFLACCLAQVAPHSKVTAAHTHTPSQCLWLISSVHSLRRRSVSPPYRKSKRPGGPYLFVLFLPLFIRTWLHFDNRCLLVNFAPVLTLGHIPSLRLRRKKSWPGCAVICYAVKRLMDVHLVFESSSCSSGARLRCASRLQ